MPVCYFESLRTHRPAASYRPRRNLRPRTLLVVALLAKLLVIAPVMLHATPGMFGQVTGQGQAWADDGGEGGEGDGGGEGEGGEGEGDGGEGEGGDDGGGENGDKGGSSGANGFALSVGAFLSALRSHGEVAASHKSNGMLSVTYSDGWTEQVVGKTYQLLDRQNRTVVTRPARASDRARLDAAIRR